MNARIAKPQPLSNIITLPRPPSRPLEISGSLPLCPCCAAPAFEGEWRGAFDLHHACDCILEQVVGYERGVQQLWEQRQRERRYLETLPTRYRAYTFNSFERTDDNTTALEVAAQLELGRTLFLWSNPGNGKTHLACAIGFRALERGSVVFWNVAALYAQLRECIAHDLPKPNLLAPSVLILDDLGKVKASEFVFETLYGCLVRGSSASRTLER